MLPLTEPQQAITLPDTPIAIPENATAILEGLDTFAVILDATLTPVYANTAAQRSKTLSELGLLQSERFARRAARVLESGKPSHWESDPHDERDTVRTHVIRIDPELLVVLIEDLGEEQRLTGMRRDFIANVSHELKTPIAAVGLLAEAVHEAADNPDLVRDFASSLLKEARRLAEMSRDIIQLSEAQSTLQPGQLAPVDIRAVVNAEIDAHDSFASRNGVSLKLIDSSNKKRTSTIQGRSSAIASAVANVLANAIRHSTDGDVVEIRIAHKKRHFTVTVTDSGDGIDPEHIERIFERFYRVDNARSREDGGTGLGLAIARHSLRAHGGDVTVRSEAGKGARFTLAFPLYDIPKKKRARRVRRTRKALKQLTDPKGHE